ncbi:hypothetical protein AQJ43_37055 [Streptomyces avermitilis]|uniref:FAD-binding domain-containing protein n=3 Tax=Streptomyces avermitilis TaxID=33903 RepID=A0A4D4N7T3_STRAX|nr:FAD-dependent monooxygenase [Streptomyces avermitilis]KUN47757.1 hypothetical protein AQJ43_37055 [Streptomyces avermitilis]BAU77512.1 putative pyridine nucleotide-disulfide oxidoreductase [Streptomyces avermitilis MA-4680 = NBRC 14893]GDY70181.1 hypothetical protein SAV14893_095740 [Streptomyces avermitilis]GDY80480.1 hypothetical protein SAV31267_099650 [Streptomyces avermitilis]
MGRAVVIGGGLAGMLAAAALAPFADDVTIVEQRDVPATHPTPGENLPQDRHVHVLMSGGAKAIEALLPGALEHWAEAGAAKIPLPSGVVSYTPGGWHRQWPAAHYLIACSRDLLDQHVRDIVLADPRIRLLDKTGVRALTGSAQRVTGVRVASREGLEWCIDADLVIDASGRDSNTVNWLAALGITGIRERHIASTLVYASRTYQAPARNNGAPLVQIATAPHTPGPRQTGTLIPIERGRWQVSLAGTGSGAPSEAKDAFVPFALQLPHPMIGQLIARAAPLTDVQVSDATGSSRRYFEDARHWPEGLVVLGDATATYNPLYGQGMSVAALHARALFHTLARMQLHAPGTARTAQKAIARLTEAAWSLSTSQDALYPHAANAAPSLADRAKGRYLNRLSQAAATSAQAAATLTQVTALEASPARLLKPSMLLAAGLGRWRRPLAYPPLTDAQRAVVNFADHPEP